MFAFDKDAQRLMTMNTLTLRAGVLCTVTQVADFLTIKPQDSMYRDVQYGIVDPSCSGSGRSCAVKHIKISMVNKLI